MAPLPKLLVLSLAAAIAICCGIISILSLVAATIALPHGATMERLQMGEDVPKEARAAAANASLRAGRWMEPGRYFSDVALSAGRLTREERQLPLEGLSLKAVTDQSLVASPASPQNWTRRANRLLAQGDMDKAKASLETSIFLGRYLPGLTVPRLAIILKLLKRRPDDQVQSWFDSQARIAAVLEPAQLARLADDPGADGRIQVALMDEFALLDRYLREKAGLKSLREEQARRGGSR